MLCNLPISPSLPSLCTEELVMFYFIAAYALLFDCFVRKKELATLDKSEFLSLIISK